ncbi:hypothetical protein ACHQM5_000046 [Ranunculus cassubicifolius]
MTLVAGSYEKFIWGYKLQSTGTPTLKPLFSYPAHLSTIKCVAVSGPVAVSGGADDAIKIYDLPSSSEVGSLMDHKGAVTALSFYNLSSLAFPRNLLSGSDDGTVSIYDADPFVHLKTIMAHKKGVNDLGIHPSGKLALTVGRDSCLAMLNLVRGRRSFYCRLDKEATIAEDAKLVLEMESQKPILCAASAMNGLLFTGGEDRNVTAWDTNTGKVAYCIEGAHSTRVKGIVVLTNRSDAIEEADDPYLVASASSDGVIRVWDVRMAKKENSTPLAEANTKSRLTCLAGTSLKCKLFDLKILLLLDFVLDFNCALAFSSAVKRPNPGDSVANKEEEE